MSDPMNTDDRSITAVFEKKLKKSITLNWEVIAWVSLFVLALISRFYNLGIRAMSHDESLHTYFSNNLALGRGFAHTPMMHGPLLFHVTALIYRLFGVSDFTSRLYPAILGVIIVMFPLLFRRWLGKKGAVAASVLLLISPMILYYSRYIRHDIPAITASLVMMLAMWQYIEKRQPKYLFLLAFGQAFMFASKEVSFIYVAVFGLFLVLFFLSRALKAAWTRESLKTVFIGLCALLLVLAGVFGAFKIIQAQQEAAAAEAAASAESVEGLPAAGLPLEGMPDETVAAAPVPTSQQPIWAIVLIAAIALCVIALVVLLGLGLGDRLRRFPELDVAVVMGTLILPHLTPFLIHLMGRNPSSELPADLQFTTIFTVIMLYLSVMIGLFYFARPPQGKRINGWLFFGILLLSPLTLTIGLIAAQIIERNRADEDEDPQPFALSEYLTLILNNRWLIIGAIYWGFTIFFFTTMFTNGNGLGTGVIGSLSYWLEQQAVERGGQPWFYYLLVQIPLYEFLPALLSLAAGVAALAVGIRRFVTGPTSYPVDEDGDPIAPPPPLDLDAPIRFPVTLMLGFMVVMNIAAYSLAGEKMPWLTTHLTMPMILLGGYFIGQMIDRFDWARVFQARRWIALLLLPIAMIAFLRVIGPTCLALPGNPLCNTVIPQVYQTAVFTGYSIQELGSAGTWLGAVVFFTAAIIGMITLGEGIRFKDWYRVAGFLLVGCLAIITARASYRASYITYDEATEFLVYAHSSDSTKVILDEIEELSLRINDDYTMKIAYDNKTSWPMSWYMQQYPNSVYFGEEPTRQLLEGAVVILAGWGNNTKVESLIGDRYYSFNYTRMWWPLEDYRTTTLQTFKDIARDPVLQRGLWEIFLNRDYDAYADAVAPYRSGTRPDYTLANWPVSDRIYVYIRKDAFAQIWRYGVTASDIAETLDPYTQNVLDLAPSATFGAGILARPHGIDIAPDGSIAVADSQNHRIAFFDPTGELVESVGSFGYAPDPTALNEPWDVTIDEGGNLYIADTWNFRVTVFSASGQPLRAWGQEGPNQVTDSFALWGPRGITTDSAGHIYLSDTGNKRVLVYTAEGEFIRQIGMGGSFEGQLDEPAGLAIGPDGSLYVADTWNQRVSVFSPDGIFLRSWLVDAWFGQSNERPYIAVDPFGRVFRSDPAGFWVIAFSSDGSYLFSFGDYSTLQSPGGLAFNADGDLFVADTEAGVILRYDHNLFPLAIGSTNDAGDISNAGSTDSTDGADNEDSAGSGSGIVPTEVNNIPRVNEDESEKNEDES